MMKILSLFLVLGLFAFTAEDKNNTANEIKILSLPGNPMPFSLSQTPYSVWMHTDYIAIQCLRQVGEVDVRIVNESGEQVLQKRMESSVNELLEISTSQLPYGNYTIYFESSSRFEGEYYGEFQLN